MTGILLTQSTTFIIGPVAKLLGFIMNAIFNFLDLVGIPNIGLAIILFTIVIYLFMTPLTIKQQKYSKLSAKMNPEIQAIQAKYKGKKDNDSMMRMNEDTKAVYEKYGTSPTGTCLPLLIQMPVLFSLYQVINSMPAYVVKVKEAFFPLIDEIITQPGATDFLQTLKSAAYFVSKKMDFTLPDTIIDVLNKCSTVEWAEIIEKFPSLSDSIINTTSSLTEYNSFLGLNIANSPQFIVVQAIQDKAYLIVVIAIMIPFLSALTQWLNMKLMPQVDTGGNDNQMANSMKTMNNIMPIMSAVFCFSLPAGLGLYWIIGAVVRSVQQVLINKHLDTIDMDEVIKHNVDKVNKKREKTGVYSQTLSDNARINTRSSNYNGSNQSENNNNTAVNNFNDGVKSGSIASKANLVKQYNEKNSK